MNVYDALEYLDECWNPVTVPVPKHLQSDAMTVHMLLLAIPRRTTARAGWFLGGLINEFREEGSPSTALPTHWMVMPPLPTDAQ